MYYKATVVQQLYNTSTLELFTQINDCKHIRNTKIWPFHSIPKILYMATQTGRGNQQIVFMRKSKGKLSQDTPTDLQKDPS